MRNAAGYLRRQNTKKRKMKSDTHKKKATEETVARVVEFSVMKLGQGQWQEAGSRLLSVYTFAPATAAASILA